MIEFNDLIVKNAPKNTGRIFVKNSRPRTKRRTWMMYGLFNYSVLHSVFYRRKDAMLYGADILVGGNTELEKALKEGWFEIRRVLVTDWGHGKKRK